MQEMTIDEVKQEQLEILDFVANFCEANGIKYWIDSGTLLGAIRHKGYIPWDDDIDVGMLRDDYDRFLELFNQQNSNYRFVCIENTPSFYLPHGKVCNNTTIFYEPDENGNKLSVNIDIFVYDNAPDDEKELNKMYDLRDKYRKIYTFKNTKRFKGRNPLRGFAKYALKFVYKILYPNVNVELMVKNSKKYSNKQTNNVGNFTAYTRMVCNKRVFSDFVDVEFEGKYYKAPIGYDEWLRSFYGDYMQLPPEEKRVSHHTYKAFYKE